MTNFALDLYIINVYMKQMKMYEGEDKMITLIRDNYDLLQMLGSFGISLGFGDKTVSETCRDNGVDTYTFLAVVNFTINGFGDAQDDEQLSVTTLMHYLEASHAYFLDFQLPFIRRELEESLNPDDSLGQLILRFYDEYAHEIRRHMHYEQRVLFPYVRGLIDGQPGNGSYTIETFSRQHSQADKKLRELKLLIIKYLPSDGLHNNKLTATLHDIYDNEEWLRQHGQVEDHIFVPAIRRLERQLQQSDKQIQKQCQTDTIACDQPPFPGNAFLFPSCHNLCTVRYAALLIASDHIRPCRQSCCHIQPCTAYRRYFPGLCQHII